MPAQRDTRGSAAATRSSKASSPRPTLDLRERLDVTAAKPLAAALLARRGAPIAINAAEVRHLGAQCAQVLLSARITWAKDGQRFQIAPSSDAFSEGIRLLGLADELGTNGQ